MYGGQNCKLTHNKEDECIMPLDFAALALYCKAALGFATPANPAAEYTTINISAGVALNPNPWNRRLDGVGLSSRIAL